MDPAAAIVCSLGLGALSGVIDLIRRLSARGKIDRNSAIGIRTRATQASDSAWRAGHRAAHPWLTVAALSGYATAMLAAGWAIVQLVAGDAGPAPLVIALGGYMVVIVVLAIAANKANVAARLISNTTTTHKHPASRSRW